MGIFFRPQLERKWCCEVSYSRLAQLGLLTYSLTLQKVRKLHFDKAQTREKRPWYETLELTWLNSDSLVEYPPKYSVTPVYLSDFVDSDGCPVRVESAQHAHLHRKWCALTLLCCAVVSVCARTIEHYSFCVMRVETHFMYEHSCAVCFK